MKVYIYILIHYITKQTCKNTGETYFVNGKEKTMAVSSRALLVNGGNIEPNLYKTDRRGNYLSPRNNKKNVNNTPNRKKRIGKLLRIVNNNDNNSHGKESSEQHKEIQDIEEEKKSTYSYISVTIPNPKKLNEDNSEVEESEFEESEQESETFHQNTKKELLLTDTQSDLEDSGQESELSHQNISKEASDKGEKYGIVYELPQLSTNNDEYNKNNEALLLQARGIFTPGTPSSRENDVLTPLSRNIFTPKSNISSSSSDAILLQQQTRDIYTPIEAFASMTVMKQKTPPLSPSSNSYMSLNNTTPPQSSSSTYYKTMEDLEEETKRKQFLYMYFNETNRKPLGKSRAMFEKTMQQTNKEINDAKGAVKSYSTRISKQYGVLNVTKRIERKLKSIEWPRNEERSEVDYTKDNPGPGSYDPIIESNLPQRSQQFLKQKRLFIPVQKLNDPPMYKEQIKETKLGPTFQSSKRFISDEDTFAVFNTPGPIYNIKSSVDIQNTKIENETKVRKKKSPFGSPTRQRPSILRCRREAKKIFTFIDNICGLNVTLKKDAMLIQGDTINNIQKPQNEHLFIGGMVVKKREKQKMNVDVSSLHEDAKFPSIQIDGSKTVSNQLNFSRRGSVFYNSQRSLRKR